MNSHSHERPILIMDIPCMGRRSLYWNNPPTAPIAHSVSTKKCIIHQLHSHDTTEYRYIAVEYRVANKATYSCSRCNKNNWHVKSSYILQPPKYVFIFIYRFGYINNNVTKDRCPIPMDRSVRLGTLKFSLRVTIDHHGPSIHSGHYTASINCCKKHSIATITQLRSLELLITKTPLLHILYYIILFELIDTWFLDSNRGVGVSSLPWHWHILSIPLTTGRGTSAETCRLDDVFPPDDLGARRPEALC